MTKDVSSTVRAVMADALGLAPGEIGDSTASVDCEGWDSVGQLRLVLALEEAFDIRFGLDEIEEAVSFPAIIRIVSAKLAA